MVVADAITVEDDFSRVDVDIPHVGLKHADVSLPLEDRSERSRDIRGREPASGNLIEKRLEQMEVPSIDEGDANRSVSERLRRVETAETAADDDDVLFQLQPSS